ncbi:HlyD family type I secretion periplasmic adaptor subunit [bacterium SCSIO 12696]|nr:HlyD family type I secretion periplasmic adaptor subunit [bacterium SCSIO 12696]
MTIQGPTKSIQQKAQRIWVSAALTLTLSLSALCLWATFAPLQSAATATGFVRVEGKKRIVQHYDGGIVDQLLALEGEYVAQGTPIMQLQTVELDRKIQSLLKKYLNLSAMQVRLSAQIKGSQSIEFPKDVTALAESINYLGALNVHQQILREEKKSLKQKLSVLDSQLSQLETDIAGQESTLKSLKYQLSLIEKRQSAMKNLAEKDLVSKKQLADIQLSVSSLSENINQAKTAYKRGIEKRRELSFSRHQLETQDKADALNKLQKIQTELPLLKEEIKLLKLKRARAQVLAPISGRITNLQVNTIGATVHPGGKLLEIVPQSERLVVEARLKPEDVDNISNGSAAKIRLTAYNTRRTLPIEATVHRLSPDRLTDEYGQAYYEVILYLNNLQQNQPLYPGMPAEVIIHTGKRHLMDYLVGSLLSGAEKALLEK